MENFRDFISFNEMPIQINKIGGWGDKSRPYGFKRDDIGIMNSDRGIAKIKQKWSKVPQNFNTYICRSALCFKQFEIGEVDEDFVRNQLGLKIVPNPTAPDEIFIDPQSINYIVTNNRGDERMPLNAWTLAHRFAHALWTSRNKTKSETYAHFEREFWRDMERIVEGVYGVSINATRGYTVDRNTSTILAKVCTAIGTMGSARKDQLRNHTEFLHELFAQYVISQKITFNPLPKSIKYFKMPDERSSYSSYSYGKPYERQQQRGSFSSLYNREPLDLESWNEYIQEGLVQQTENHLGHVLLSCVGKIYVM